MRKILIVNPHLYAKRRTVMRGRHRQPLDLAYIAALLRSSPFSKGSTPLGGRDLSPFSEKSSALRAPPLGMEEKSSVLRQDTSFSKGGIENTPQGGGISDFDVRLVDAAAEEMRVREMTAVVRSFTPDVLITTTTPVDRWECPQSYIDSFFDWLEEVARLSRKPTIIVTGTHGTTQPDWLLGKAPAIDFLVRGEPERTTERLVRLLASGGHPSAIPGVSYRQEQRIFHTPPAPRITDLDALPLPAYDLLPMEKYRYTFGDIPQPFSIVLASRGCPFRCTFCCRVMMDEQYVVRDPVNVYAELKYLAQRFGVRGVYFQDWEFLIHKPNAQRLLDLLSANPLDITWGCNVRADDFRTPEIFEKMKKAGCARVNIGFESAAPAVLAAIQKCITPADLANAISVSRRVGLKLGLYALLNAPGETAATIRETMQFLQRAGIRSMNFNLVVPYFGTEVHRALVEQLGPEAAAQITWDTLEDYAGRVDTQLSPWFARLYQQHVKQQLRYGRWYFLQWRLLVRLGQRLWSRGEKSDNHQ